MRDLAAVPGARAVAVGSRSQASADRFGDGNDVPRRHPSYEALAADPEVDAVYVATPHPLHAQNALAAIAAGKHVLWRNPSPWTPPRRRRSSRPRGPPGCS